MTLVPSGQSHITLGTGVGVAQGALAVNRPVDTQTNACTDFSVFLFKHVISCFVHCSVFTYFSFLQCLHITYFSVYIKNYKNSFFSHIHTSEEYSSMKTDKHFKDLFGLGSV